MGWDHNGATRASVRRVATAIGLTAIGVTAIGTLTVVGSPFPVAVGQAGSAAAAAPGPTSAYVAVQPCRLTDTRLGTGSTRIDANTLNLATAGRCGLPAGATALSLTLTVVDPQGSGFLTAWPANQAMPTASSLNFNARQVRANGSITRVDGTGAFRVHTSVAADVIVDVVGAFVPASSAKAGRFVATAPSRIYDSRQAGQRFGPNTAFALPMPSGVPADAIALSMNVTLTDSVGPGYVSVYPSGSARPTSSILNVDAANETRAASAVMSVSASGMSVFVSGGGHIVVDVLGYFTGPSAKASGDGLFTAYDPTRLLDTRGASPLGNGVPVFAKGGLELATSQGGSIAYNITSVDGDAGFATAFPAGTAMPSTSTVNSVGGGDVVANFGITQVSNRGLGIFSQNRTHLLIDLEGWFSGPSASAVLPPLPNVDPGSSASAGPGVVSYSACDTSGLALVNGRRALVGVPPLSANARANDFACSWAMHMAQAFDPANPSAAMTHSAQPDRDAAVGCGAGENVAFASGTSSATLFTMWFASAPHLRNIVDRMYAGAGFGFVVRTEPNGSQTIWGANEFTLC